MGAKTLSQSGTTSALSIGSETQLGSDDTNNGEFTPIIDTSNLVNGDLLEIRIYVKNLSGDSFVQCYKGTYQHAQINNNKIGPTVPSDISYKVTLKQVAGTGRTFKWKFLLDKSASQTGDNYARIGAPAGASMSADIAAVKSDSGAIKAKTDNLPSDPADASDIAGAFSVVGSAITTVNSNVTAVKDKTDNLPASPAATGDIPTANQNADALLDRAAGVETGWTFRQAMRIILSAVAGKASGLGTTTAKYRDMADSKDRISATVDSDGNRTAVTRDAS